MKPTPNPFSTHRVASSLLGAILVLCAAPMTGCGGYDTYVKSDNAALGRVVVYRNGVAYFERRASTNTGQLQLTVPENKVNDFLKSLTVADAKTGEALPVAFPTKRKSGNGKVAMTIRLPNAKQRDVVLSYITDAPAWKSTYRVMVDRKGGVKLQGWAIVDNTSGEDWQAVKIGVGSSSALSFRYDLRSIRRVYRRMLQTKHRLAIAPPRGGAVHRGTGGKAAMAFDLRDEDIPRPVGHPEREVAAAARAEAAPRGGSWWGKAVSKAKEDDAEEKRRRVAYEHKKRRWQRSQQRASSRVRSMAKRLASSQGQIVIEGYAAKGERSPRDRALDRANTLRNALIKEGVAPARLKVKARGVVAGRGSGVRVMTKRPATGNRALVQNDEPVGESHFESNLAMSVAKGTSAMVSVVNKATQGEIVYLFDPDARRGNRRYAFKSVRFDNPTESTLESGPMTVYGAGRFIGEGMSDPIPPKSKAIVPFAMDRQVRIDKSADRRDDIAKLIDVKRGILRAEVHHVRVTRYTVHNRSTKTAPVFIRHRVRNGWKLENPPKKWEKLGDARLVKITLKAGEQRVVKVEESTPLQRTVDLRSPVGVELMRRYLADASNAELKGKFGQNVRQIVDEHSRIGHLGEAIAHLRQRNVEYRTRMDELHGQIMSLKMVRTGGSLMRHLQKKMKEMSQAVQKTTIQVVNTEEQLMLSRIRFHDEISELILPSRRAATAITPEKETKRTTTGA